MCPEYVCGQISSTADDALYQRNTRHTTHLKDFPQSVVITREGHPFEGQALQALGKSKRDDRAHLLIELPDQSRSLIPVDWTNWSENSAQTVLKTVPRSTAAPTLATISALLHTRVIVDALLTRSCALEEPDNAATPSISGNALSSRGGVGTTR